MDVHGTKLACTLLAEGASMGQVRAVAEYALGDLAAWMAESRDGAGAEDRAHFRMLEADIARFLQRSHEPVETPASPQMPPGSPIGATVLGWLDAKRVTRSNGTGWIDLSCR